MDSGVPCNVDHFLHVAELFLLCRYPLLELLDLLLGGGQLLLGCLRARVGSQVHSKLGRSFSEVKSISVARVPAKFRRQLGTLEQFPTST